MIRNKGGVQGRVVLAALIAALVMADSVTTGCPPFRAGLDGLEYEAELERDRDCCAAFAATAGLSLPNARACDKSLNRKGFNGVP